MRPKILYAILIIVIIFGFVGCATPPTQTATPIATTTPTLTQTSDLETKIKSLESKIEQLNKDNQNITKEYQFLRRKITEIILFSDEQLIPTVPFKIIMKRSAGHGEFAYEIGMDPASGFTKSKGLSDSGILKTGARWDVPYTIYRENNTIAVPMEFYDFYSLRIVDKNRVASMYAGFPDHVREYEIQLARWDPVEGVYKW